MAWNLTRAERVARCFAHMRHSSTSELRTLRQMQRRLSDATDSQVRRIQCELSQRCPGPLSCLLSGWLHAGNVRRCAPAQFNGRAKVLAPDACCQIHGGRSAIHPKSAGHIPSASCENRSPTNSVAFLSFFPFPLLGEASLFAPRAALPRDDRWVCSVKQRVQKQTSNHADRASNAATLISLTVQP